MLHKDIPVSDRRTDELVRSTLVGWGAELDRVQALQDRAHGLVEQLPTSD